MGDEGFYIPKRYILAALGFLGIFNMYTMRTNLGIAIVAMVNNTANPVFNSSDFSNECPNLISQEQEIEVEKVGMKYNWSAQEQSLMLGSFYIGYVITQLPGGYLSEKFGAKWIFGGGILSTAILTVLSPLIVSWNANAFIVVRVIEGLGEGMTFPAMNLMISQWSPKSERSRISTVVWSGCAIGSVLSMVIAGWLCSSNVLGGWPSTFYLFGAASILWFVFWSFLTHESPSVHPTISLQELQYNQDNNEKRPENRPEKPWKAIFSSLPLWAALVAHMGNSMGLFTFMAELPTYLNTVLHFDIKANGILSALPFAAQAVGGFIASPIADNLRKSNTLSITNIRKIFNTIGLIGPAVCLLVVTVAGCRPYLIVSLITIGLGINGCVFAGFNVIHIDMSRTFAGTLYAITNTAAVSCGFIGPAIAGAFIDSGATIENWNYVFYIIAGTYILAAAFFAAFASAEPQPWGTEKKELTPETKF